MIGRPKFVLASGSPRRLALINQAGIEPDALKPADLDETPRRSEIPRAYATRLAQAKATAALENVNLDDELRGAFILAADTVVAVGRRILPKAELLDEAAQCLRLLSGRSHRVYTGVTVVTATGKLRQKLVETRVRFKRLGKEGDPVTIKILRPSTGENLDFTIVRQKIEITAVTYAMLPNNVALIRLSQFSTGVTNELKAAIRASCRSHEPTPGRSSRRRAEVPRSPFIGGLRSPRMVRR